MIPLPGYGKRGIPCPGVRPANEQPSSVFNVKNIDPPRAGVGFLGARLPEELGHLEIQAGKPGLQGLPDRGRAFTWSRVLDRSAAFVAKAHRLLQTLSTIRAEVGRHRDPPLETASNSDSRPRPGTQPPAEAGRSSPTRRSDDHSRQANA